MLSPMPAMSPSQIAEDQFFNHRGPPVPEIPGVNTNVVLPPQPGLLDRMAQGTGEIMGGLRSEGPLGLLDIEGIRDRQRAHQELLRKFDVIPDNFQGTRLPNQVTGDEYSDVVRQYSDIRLGRADLKVDGAGSADARQFQADAMDDIGDIMQTASGRALIGQLGNNKRPDATGKMTPRTTTIRPHLLPGSTVPDTSTAFERSLDATNTPTVSIPGEGAPFANGSPGLGSNTEVQMNPNLDARVPDPISGTISTFRSDTTMFHELTHALHDTQGTTDNSPVAATDAIAPAVPHAGFASDAANNVSRYEHQAVGLGLHANSAISENAYRRERRLLGSTQAAMPGDTLMSDREFYTAPQTYNDMFGR
jgi:hypothetical protein